MLQTSTHPLPLRHLTPAEIHERRSKSLCYSYDKRFQLGHKCKSPQFLTLVGPDHENQYEDTNTLLELTESQPEPPTNDLNPSNPLEHPIPTLLLQPPALDNAQFHLSIAAYLGFLNPKTLRVTCTINGHHFTILIDSNNTHNIIQPRVVEFLKLNSQDMP